MPNSHRYFTLNLRCLPLLESPPMDEKCNATNPPKTFLSRKLDQIKYHKIPIHMQCRHLKNCDTVCSDPGDYFAQSEKTKSWEGPYHGAPFQVQINARESVYIDFVEGLIGARAKRDDVEGGKDEVKQE